VRRRTHPPRGPRLASGTVAPVTDRVDELLEQLRARGDRVTTARRAVLVELLEAEGRHLSAEELVERIGPKHPDIHLSTVYRTLEFLRLAGIIVQVRVDRDAAAYHVADHGHHHAVCATCGAMIEFPDQVLRSLVNRLARDHGFVAEPRHLVIDGRCAACAAADN